MWNDSDTVQNVTLTAHVQSVSTGQLLLTFNHAEVRRLSLNQESASLIHLILTLPPGASQLEWHFDGRLVRPQDDPRQLGFQVTDLTLVPTH